MGHKLNEPGGRMKPAAGAMIFVWVVSALALMTLFGPVGLYLGAAVEGGISLLLLTRHTDLFWEWPEDGSS